MDKRIHRVFAEKIEDVLECDGIVPSVEQCLVEDGSIPSMDEWLRDAKATCDADKIGMYLTHNGVVRATPRVQVRGEDAVAQGSEVVKTVTDEVNVKTGQEENVSEGHGNIVKGMQFAYDKEKVLKAIAETYKLPGVYYVRVWMTDGELNVGDDIMYVLIGGDIRPHVVDALDFLVGKLKNECVYEKEIY